MTTKELRDQTIKAGDVVEAAYSRKLKKMGIEYRQQCKVEKVVYVKGRRAPYLKLKGVDQLVSRKLFQRDAPIDLRRKQHKPPFKVGDMVVAKRSQFATTQGLTNKPNKITHTNGSPTREGQYVKLKGYNTFIVASSFKLARSGKKKPA
ncbi:MAG: hypothetical protein R2820_05360 [Cyclobacteriaceae bacterium]|nr:hypothetical protein [Cyclobacteriaceae bacterium]